jgi:hypothetical protein
MPKFGSCRTSKSLKKLTLVGSLAKLSDMPRSFRHFCSGKNLPRFLIAEYSDFPSQRAMRTAFQAHPLSLLVILGLMDPPQTYLTLESPKLKSDEKKHWMSDYKNVE